MVCDVAWRGARSERGLPGDVRTRLKKCTSALGVAAIVFVFYQSFSTMERQAKVWTRPLFVGRLFKTFFSAELNFKQKKDVGSVMWLRGWNNTASVTLCTTICTRGKVYLCTIGFINGLLFRDGERRCWLAAREQYGLRCIAGRKRGRDEPYFAVLTH